MVPHAAREGQVLGAEKLNCLDVLLSAGNQKLNVQGLAGPGEERTHEPRLWFTSIQNGKTLMTRDGGVEHQQQLTRVLQQINQNGGQIADEAMPLIYGELRRLAQSIMQSERSGHTLQATAIVNEVYIRLVEESGANIENRAHFIGRVARMMRRFLVDYARERNAQKRGGNLRQVTLGAADEDSGQDADLVALDDALLSLSKKDPEMVRLVELRYFGGLTLEQTAEVLGISRASVVLAWRRTKVWLRRELGQE